MSGDTYEVGPSPRVDVRIERGSIELLPGDDGTVTVELGGRGADDVRVDATPGSVTVTTPGRLLRGGGRVEARITVPADCRASLGIATGTIDVRAPVSELQAAAASGDLRVGRIGQRATLKTASGDIRAEELTGRATVTSGSGDVTIGLLSGNGRLTTASGDIEVVRLAGELDCKVASGNISVGRMDEGRLGFRTASGDTTVAVAPGRRVQYDVKSVTGTLRLPGPPPPPPPPEPGVQPTTPTDKPLVRIEGRSVSGDTTLKHADA